jgi:hypothetical protein
MMRRTIWVGAGAAAAARLARRAYQARRRSAPVPEGQRLTVRATIAPELVADLTDLLRRVTGRAASDEAGGISISLAPGVDPSDIERDLHAVIHRWSEMHPGIRVYVAAGAELPHLPRRRKFRRGVEAEEPVAAASSGMWATPPPSS